MSLWARRVGGGVLLALGAALVLFEIAMMISESHALRLDLDLLIPAVVLLVGALLIWSGTRLLRPPG